MDSMTVDKKFQQDAFRLNSLENILPINSFLNKHYIFVARFLTSWLASIFCTASNSIARRLMFWNRRTTSIVEFTFSGFIELCLFDVECFFMNCWISNSKSLFFIVCASHQNGNLGSERSIPRWNTNRQRHTKVWIISLAYLMFFLSWPLFILKVYLQGFAGWYQEPKH